MPKVSKHAQLTAMEERFVEAYTEGKNTRGNGTQSAKVAGYKRPREAASELLRRSRVIEAIAARKLEQVEARKEEIRAGVRVTRNDIINRLDRLSTKAKSESVRVGALRELKDIFGLSVQNGKSTDLFAGWTDEELESYRTTGILPARIRSAVGTSQSDGSNSGAPVPADSRTT